MMLAMLGMVLGIFWGIISGIALLIYGAIIISDKLDLDEMPTKKQITYLVILTFAVPVIWWFVWVCSLYV